MLIGSICWTKVSVFWQRVNSKQDKKKSCFTENKLLKKLSKTCIRFSYCHCLISLIGLMLHDNRATRKKVLVLQLKVLLSSDLPNISEFLTFTGGAFHQFLHHVFSCLNPYIVQNRD